MRTIEDRATAVAQPSVTPSLQTRQKLSSEKRRDLLLPVEVGRLAESKIVTDDILSDMSDIPAHRSDVKNFDMVPFCGFRHVLSLSGQTAPARPALASAAESSSA